MESGFVHAEPRVMLNVRDGGAAARVRHQHAIKQRYQELMSNHGEITMRVNQTYT
jgi:hypothetical protein